MGTQLGDIARVHASHPGHPWRLHCRVLEGRIAARRPASPRVANHRVQVVLLRRTEDICDGERGGERAVDATDNAGVRDDGGPTDIGRITRHPIRHRKRGRVEISSGDLSPTHRRCHETSVCACVCRTPRRATTMSSRRAARRYRPAITPALPYLFS